MFNIGDRVISVKKWQSGVRVGELGTVIDVWESGASVYWDEYKSNRHTCEGRVPMGHGWHVALEVLAFAEAVDLGEFDANLAPGSIDDLLGGLL